MSVICSIFTIEQMRGGLPKTVPTEPALRAFGGVLVDWVLQTESVLRTCVALGWRRCGEARQGWRRL